jgi:hypothetical protein
MSLNEKQTAKKPRLPHAQAIAPSLPLPLPTLPLPSPHQLPLQQEPSHTATTKPPNQKKLSQLPRPTPYRHNAKNQRADVADTVKHNTKRNERNHSNPPNNISIGRKPSNRQRNTTHETCKNSSYQLRRSPFNCPAPIPDSTLDLSHLNSTLLNHITQHFTIFASQHASPNNQGAAWTCLNFCIRQSVSNGAHALTTDRFQRDAHTRMFFASALPFTGTNLFHRTDWQPHKQEIPTDFHSRINEFTTALKTKFQGRQRVQSNLLDSQQRSLKWLINNPELVVFGHAIEKPTLNAH